MAANTTPGKKDLETLEKLYKEFEHKKSLMIYLQQIQTKFGFVPEYSIRFLSEKMNVAESHIYGVITFYAQFRTKPVGKNMIKVCHGTACHVGGATILSEAINEFLGVDEINDTTEDGEFTVQDVACLGCCALAPAVMVNDKVHGKLDVNRVKTVIDSYRKSAK
jgi:NADH-quinone oxidoreductase subunit E